VDRKDFLLAFPARDLREAGCWGIDWIGVAQVRERWRADVITVMKIQVP
jgi:hypothetical protein